MNKKTIGIMAVIIILCVSVIIVPYSRSAQDDNAHYKAAYKKWRDIINKNPHWGDPNWFDTSEHAHPELRNAMNDLIDEGVGIAPFLVEKIRATENQMELYQDILLLGHVCGVDIYYDYRNNIHAEIFEIRERLLNEWDAGIYNNVTEHLEKTIGNSYDSSPDSSIIPKSLLPIRRYGLFAMPYMINHINKSGSKKLFAAYLITIGESNLYADYLKKPSGMFSTVEEKKSHIKAWISRHEKRFSKNEKLRSEIMNEAKGLN